MQYVVEYWIQDVGKRQRIVYRVGLVTGCDQIGTLRGKNVSLDWTTSQNVIANQIEEVEALAKNLVAEPIVLSTIRTWRGRF